ncbi:uracil-DNA glycosylase [Kineococcus arenarius]|uniref:uracil-DNA glycosylase n=1 Tax=unclassified Kineococcus TaxID=2621656 RepID=UPI003D7E54A4
MSTATTSGTERVLRGVINKLAYERGELLSAVHCPEVLADRRERTYDGVIGDLNRWVDTIRERTRESVPYFDPTAAGEGTRVLVLLQDPSQEAEVGSGFISRHNNDPTARNIYLAAEQAGLHQECSLLWNIVPWWVANPARQGLESRRSLKGEAARARPYILELVQKLPQRPAAIVLAGRQAQTAWGALGDLDLRGITVLSCPHPSPLAFPKKDATGKPNSETIIEVFRQAAELARS